MKMKTETLFLGFSRQERVFLVLLVLVAALLRLYRLDAIPPGFHFDQAFYVFDAVRLLQGQFAIFFAAPGGSEPLYVYLATVGVSLFGVSAIGLKLTSAIIGIVTIPVIYSFARDFLGSRLAAGVAATLATISVWMIFYSRDGERVGLESLMALLTLWFFWRALTRIRSRSFVYAGIFLGIALYTYPAVRVIPFILIVATIYFVLTDRTNTRDLMKGLGLTLGIAAVMFVPLGVYFVFNPDQFLGHTVQVSVLSGTGENASVLQVVFDNAVRVLKMFVIQGDSGLIRNIPNRPVFDWFVAPLFAVGVVVWGTKLLPAKDDAARLNQKRAVFLLVWLAIGLGVSLVSDDAPNFGRLNQTAPAIFVLAGWGALWIAEHLKGRLTRRVGFAALAILVGLSGLVTFRDYFLEFGPLPALYYAFDADKVEIADWIQAKVPTSRIFLAPLYYQQGTISLLTRTMSLDSFESRDTIVLPGASGGKDAFYAYPPEQDKKLETLAGRLGKIGATEALTGTLGARLLGLYHIPVKNLPSHRDPLSALARGGAFLRPAQTTSAQWQDNFELLGYTVDASDAAQRNLMVTLVLRALAPISKDYTFSVKAADDRNRVWGQEDKWAGDNSYATTQWKADDVVVERFYPGLEACAPAGNYHLTVEAYDPKTHEVVSIGNGGTQVGLGSKAVQASGGNRLEDLDPDNALNEKIFPAMSLIGYNIVPSEHTVGSDFSLSLFWKGNSDGAKGQNAKIHLKDSAGHEFPLTEVTIVPPAANRGLCSFFDLKLPAESAEGTGGIYVNDFKIADIKVTR